VRNCIVLGSGRSGTSMVAGALVGQGYFMGHDLYIEPRGSNPKGFFEDRHINAINELLLAEVPEAASFAFGQRWLACVPVGAEIRMTDELGSWIEDNVSRQPFAFKDPRFCYTLPAWVPFLTSTVFVCVFREPARTARSIVTECRQAEYLRGVEMDFAAAVAVWRGAYSHVLQHRRVGEWIFVHYEQLLDRSAFPRLEEALGARLDPSFVDPSLRRSTADGAVGAKAATLYRELCRLAGYPANA
jgi:hypothetical protein